LQAYPSTDNFLASYLYNDGVVQAVTFAYLIYWWIPCTMRWVTWVVLLLQL